jgi:TPR repeat protein
MNMLSRIVLITALCMNMEAVAATPLEQGIAAIQRGEETKAIQILQPLAARGDVQAQYYLGLGYGYSPEAAKWFRKAAEQGHAKAQYFLYSLYRDGLGVAQDPTEASKWLHKAAVGGSDSAQYSLGLESAMAGNQGEAAKWYRLAAAQAHDSAQLELGRLYRDGLGVKRDFVRAYMWLLLAAEAGNQTAKEECAFAEKQALTPQEVTQGRAKAKHCRKHAFKHCD